MAPLTDSYDASPASNSRFHHSPASILSDALEIETKESDKKPTCARSMSEMVEAVRSEISRIFKAQGILIQVHVPST